MGSLLQTPTEEKCGGVRCSDSLSLPSGVRGFLLTPAGAVTAGLWLFLVLVVLLPVSTGSFAVVPLVVAVAIPVLRKDPFEGFKHHPWRYFSKGTVIQGELLKLERSPDKPTFRIAEIQVPQNAQVQADKLVVTFRYSWLFDELTQLPKVGDKLQVALIRADISGSAALLPSLGFIDKRLSLAHVAQLWLWPISALLGGRKDPLGAGGRPRRGGDELWI